MKKFLAVILAMLGVTAASIGLAEESAMEAEQGHPILQTAVTVLFNQSEGCLRLLSATGLPSTKQFAHWHLACPHGSENPDSGAPNSRRSVHKSATVWR